MDPDDIIATPGTISGTSAGSASAAETRRVLDLFASPALSSHAASKWQSRGHYTDPRRSANRRTIVVAALVLALAATGSYAYVAWSVSPVRPDRPQPAAAVAAVAVPPTTIQAQGYVVARRQATVSAETTGRMVELLVSEGAVVRGGQPIAHLNSRIATAQVDYSTAQLEVTKRTIEVSRARLDAAKTVLGRRSLLAADGWVSKEALDTARDQVRQLSAQLQADLASIIVSEKQLNIERQSLLNSDIVAPFDGRVTAVSANVGEIVSPISAGGGFTRTGICTVTDFTSLEGEVDLSEHLLDKVQIGTPVRIHLKAYPDLLILGRVSTIVPSVDRGSAAVQVRLKFDTIPEQTFPGMRIDVTFETMQP